MNGQPIQFEVTLTAPSAITLSLYTVAGELMYQATIEGNTGSNVMTWNLVNQAGQAVASGVYLYQMNIPEGFSGTQPHGMVAVLH